MKRIVSLLLSLLMVLSLVAALAACKKDETPEDTGDVANIDLTAYTVIYGSELTPQTKSEASKMANLLRSYTGLKDMRAWEDGKSEEIEEEILVGKTDRDASAKALNKIKGDGWTVRVIDKKIVIVGTTPFLTRMALAYFMETCVQEDKIADTTISVTKEKNTFDLTMLEFSAGEDKFNIIYGDDVDDVVNGKGYGSDLDPAGGEQVDAVFEYCSQIQTLAAEKLNVEADTLKLKKESSSTAKYEILVGNMNRAAYKTELAKLNGNEYGIMVKDGKIMLLAGNDVLLKLTGSLLDEMIKGSSKDGKCVLPEGILFKTAATQSEIKADWAVDFPKPVGENMTLHGTVDLGNDTLEYIYSGIGADRNAYNAYLLTLQEAGYRVIMENAAGNDVFRTLVNDAAKITLHVYLTTYSWANTYQDTITAKTLPGIRVVAAKTDLVNIPSADILSSSVYDSGSFGKSNASNITQLMLNYRWDPDNKNNSFGNSYFITLSDGTFVIYDGGASKGFTGQEDMENMYDCLLTMYKKTHNNQTPTPQNPLHIRAWILSHEHMDHYNVFKKFCETHGKDEDLQLDALLFNPVSDSERKNTNNPDSKIYTGMKTLQSKVRGGFQFIKMHTGQVFYFNNMKLEVLFTHEDIYPNGVEYFNNTSTIIRTTLKTEDGKTSTMIWGGDAERVASDIICAMYGPTLKSDMVQVTHHGYNSVRSLYYELIAPKVCWWPTDRKNFYNRSFNKSNAWDRLVCYNLARQESVQMMLCADVCNMYLTITGTADDYGVKNLKNLDSDVALTAKTYTATDKTGITNMDVVLIKTN